MKISGFGNTRGIQKSDKSKKGSKTSKAKSSSSSATSESEDSDEVQLGDHVATLDLIRDLVSGSPDIRVDQVDRIMRELKGGKYKIDFEKVAEGFLKEAVMTEILRKPRKK